MKILVVGRFGPEAFGAHIAETLMALQHEVVRFDVGVQERHVGGRFSHRLDQVRRTLHSMADSVPALRRKRMHKLWDLIGDSQLDAAIVCYDFLWPAEVAELKARTGAQVALWFPDSVANVGRAYFLNAPYDALFFKDPYLVQAMKGFARTPVYYLPECFNPIRHRLDPVGTAHIPASDIVTAGTLHSHRVAIFEQLSEYRAHIWGPPPPLWMNMGHVEHMYQGRPIADAEKAAIFSSAKIVLNTLHFSEVLGLNARAFEVAGIGAFQMVDWRPGLAQLFDDGKELVSFRGIEDLKRQIDFWLPREGERKAIAEAGKRRALAHHTYERRLSLLLDTLGGAAAGFAIQLAPEPG